MSLLRQHFAYGTITDNPLSDSATTINSAGFANLLTVSSDELYLTLDPDEAGGDPEIVKVTAHSASATSVTVTRAQMGTVARAHNSGTKWRHSLYTTDVIVNCTSSTRPTTGLYEGLMIYETDTDLYARYTGSTWVYPGPIGVLTRATSTSDVASSAASDTTIVTASAVTPKSNRYIRVTAGTRYFSSSTTTDLALFRLKSGSTVIREWYGECRGNAVFMSAVLSAPSAVSTTYSYTVQRFSGSGTITAYGSNTGGQHELVVEDIGPV